MKRRIIVAATALMMVAGIAGGQTEFADAASKKVSISKKNFPDSVFRELVKANYDKNKDNKLSTSEIKKAKKFGSSSCKNTVKVKPSKYGKYVKKYVKDIKNFKGIERLTYLQKIVANETSAKSINLKKNKKLVYLEMIGGKLKKLDLNSNKKLKYVYVQYNPLTSLKMNKCKKLIHVNLMGHMVKNVKIDRNKKTEVIGEEYFAPFDSTTIKEEFGQLNEGGRVDANGNYCIYEWASDNSSCVKKTLSQNAMNRETINMNASTITKIKELQVITGQWQDAQGNFYLLADKDGKMVGKSVYYLYKINKDGAIENEVKLNDQMEKDCHKGHFVMRYIGQDKERVILGIDDLDNLMDGVVYFDTNKMQVVKQATCDFRPLAAEGDVVIGASEYNFDIVVSKMANGTKKSLEDGSEIEFFELRNGHKLVIPRRTEYHPYSVQIKDNYIYLLSSNGLYKSKFTGKRFEKLYGVSKLADIQKDSINIFFTMKTEKEIYFLSENKDTDTEKVTYKLQVGTIK